MTASVRNDTHSLTLCQVTPDQIPSALREIGNWLTFALSRDSEGKLKKDPRSGRGRGKAKCDDPATWCAFGQALRLVNGKSGHMLGFALPEDRSITLIDLDHARDPHTGEIAAWAVPILARFRGTYSEISASGEGFHIWLLGTKPEGGCKRGGVEVYSGGPKHGRMVTVTGQRYNDAPVMLAALQSELDAFCAEVFPVKAPKATPAPAQHAIAPLSMDDTELLTRARNNPDPVKAARFRALYDAGDISGYKSRSEAVAALANDLAYYCGPNGEDAVDRLLQQSALADEKMERADIRARAIELAYRGRSAFYQPREKSIDFEAPETPPENQLNNSGDGEDLARLQAENARMRQQLAQIRAIVNADGTQVAPLEKVIQIDFIVNAFADEKHRDADGFAVITIKAQEDEETGKIKGKPGLADRHGMSAGSVRKALDNIKAFGTVRFDRTEDIKLKNGNVVSFNRIAPAERFAPKWERPSGPRKKMGGARPNAGRPRKQGDPCSNPLCDGILIERRGVETTEREFAEIICPSCGERHGEPEYTGKVTSSTRYYTPQKNQLISDDDDATAWPDVAAAKSPQSTSVDASVRKLENLPADVQQNQLISPPPSRPCIKCRAYDWRADGDQWYCGNCMPVPTAAAG